MCHAESTDSSLTLREARHILVESSIENEAEGARRNRDQIGRSISPAMDAA